MKITEALLAEHSIFLGVFDEFERALPNLATLTQVQTMATIVEGMLKKHAEAETNLAYLALDHALENRGELKRMHQEHLEMDARLRDVQTARTCAAARRLLGEALAASRAHFQGEERSLFPLLEEVLQEETLVQLGGEWLHRSGPSPAKPDLAAR